MAKKNKWLSLPLIMAACVTEGAFSLVGMLLCLKGVPRSMVPVFAGASALFAVTIEGEVFAQNIAPSVEQLVKKDVLLHRRLRLLIAEKFNQDRQTNNQFLQYYAKNFHALRAFKEWHVHGKKNHDERNRAIAELEARLYWMERTLLSYFQQKNNLLTKDINRDLSAFKWENEKTSAPALFFKQYTHRRLWMMGCNFFNALALAGCFLCDIYMSNQFFLFFGISLTASTGGMAALLIISALAACAISVMLYQAYSKIVAYDLHRTYWRQIKASIASHLENKAYGKMIGLVLTILVFSALFAVVMLGTVGTWWKSGLKGQKILFALSGLPIKLLVGTFTAAYTLIMGIFTFQNIVDTIYLLGRMHGKALWHEFLGGLRYVFIEPVKELFGDQSLFAHSHWLVNCLLVPLLILPTAVLQVAVRFVYKVYAALSFIWHCISEGATTDQAYFVPARVASIAGGIIEGATDLSYVHEEGGCGGHKPDHEHKALPEMDVVEDDGHSHANIAGKLFVIAFTIAPLLPIMSLLHSFLSGLSFKACWKATAGKFWSAGHHHHHKHADEHHHHHHHKHADEHEHEHHHADEDKPALPRINKKVEYQRGLLELKGLGTSYASKSTEKARFFNRSFETYRTRKELPDNHDVLKGQRGYFSWFHPERTHSEAVWEDDMADRLAVAAAA